MRLTARLATTRREFTVDVELVVSAETLVIVGPSGSGKTTVLRMLAGLVTPESGRVVLDGVLLHDSAGRRPWSAAPEHRGVGMVFQDYALFPHLSVADNVAYGLGRLPRAERAARVEATLRRVDLARLAHARPGEISGGERQRVAVARAIATEPRLLLLDEPLSALDVDTRASVRHELRELLRDLAIPCIVVTHDFSDAEALADRIAVMDRGRIVQQAAPYQVRARPANAFVAQFTGATVLPASLVGLPGEQVAVGPRRIGLRLGDTTAGDGVHSWRSTVTAVHLRGGERWATLHRPDRLAVPAGDLRISAGDVVTAVVDPADISPLLAVAGTPTVGPGETARADQPAGTDPTGSTAEIDRPAGSAPAAVVPGRRAGRRHSPTPAAAGPVAIGSRLHRSVGAALLVLLALIVGAARVHPGAARPTAAAATDSGPLVALVAANATQPFNAVIAGYQHDHTGQTVKASYAGTQILFTQLQQGAPADLFLSADLDHMTQARTAGLVDRYTAISRNDEVIVVPRSNPAGVTGLHDLATKPLKLVVGVPEVPIGKYTAAVFKNAAAEYGPDFVPQVNAHVVSTETDVKQVLHKVALDEADAGVVYRTDVTPDVAGQVQIVEIPSQFRVIATNYAAALARPAHPGRAQALLAYLLSPAGQADFRKLGYSPPTSKPTPVPSK